MRKIAMTLLATAVAVPMMFAADAPKAATTTAPATTKTAKHHKRIKKGKTAAAVKAVSTKPVK